MSENNPPLASAPIGIPQWDPDVVYPMLADKQRRRLFFALAQGGPKPGSQMHEGHRTQVGTTLKQLAAMCEVGIVVKMPNPKDGRQPLYGLSPSVRITTTPTGKIVDFGICTVLLESASKL